MKRRQNSLPRVESGEVGRLEDAGALIAAVQVARAQGARHRVAVSHDRVRRGGRRGVRRQVAGVRADDAVRQVEAEPAQVHHVHDGEHQLQPLAGTRRYRLTPVASHNRCIMCAYITRESLRSTPSSNTVTKINDRESPLSARLRRSWAKREEDRCDGSCRHLIAHSSRLTRAQSKRKHHKKSVDRTSPFTRWTFVNRRGIGIWIWQKSNVKGFDGALSRKKLVNNVSGLQIFFE